MEKTEKLYTDAGGRFFTKPEEIRKRLMGIKAFVFDWDGVFNNGQKSASGGSNFSEVDSMGVNLLRFAYYMHFGKLPLTLVISGEKNETAFYFSRREGFAYSFSKVAHKRKALDFLCEKEQIKPYEIAYFFDDVLDIPIAEVCGLRMQVNQGINPLFIEYCVKHQLVDYLSAAAGGSFAVREMTELLIGIYGNYNEVIAGRTGNSELYQKYISERKMVQPGFFTLKEEGIVKADDQI